jgi:hypothetical protein
MDYTLILDKNFAEALLNEAQLFLWRSTMQFLGEFEQLI